MKLASEEYDRALRTIELNIEKHQKVNTGILTRVWLDVIFSFVALVILINIEIIRF